MHIFETARNYCCGMLKYIEKLVKIITLLNQNMSFSIFTISELHQKKAVFIYYSNLKRKMNSLLHKKKINFPLFKIRLKLVNWFESQNFDLINHTFFRVHRNLVILVTIQTNKVVD